MIGSQTPRNSAPSGVRILRETGAWTGSASTAAGTRGYPRRGRCATQQFDDDRSATSSPTAISPTQERAGRAPRVEERYRTISSSVDSLLLIEPETGAILEFNENAHKALGYTRRNSRDSSCPTSSRRVSAGHRTAHSEGAPHRPGPFHTQHRTKSGELRDVHVSVAAISLAASAAYRASGATSPAASARQRTQESEERLPGDLRAGRRLHLLMDRARDHHRVQRGGVPPPGLYARGIPEAEAGRH